MTNKLIKYSFLIPTKNNIHFTERCILSLIDDLDRENIDLETVEIIFLDSNSIDGIEELVQHYRGLNIRILETPEDNFSKKNNAGAKVAQGEFLILLNNDTEVLENLIRPMEAAFADPTVGVVSNKHFFPSMALNHVGIAYRDDRTPVHLYPHEHDKYPFLKISRKVPAVTAACVMFRTKDFLEVGGFDEKYVYGYEDVDLCLKFKKELNKDCFVAVDSKIIHFGQSSWGRERGEDANRAYFLEKWKDTELTPFQEIYKKDSYEKIKSREKVSKGAFIKFRNLIRRNKPQIQTEPVSKVYDAKTVVFFFDDVFNSFNVVQRNLFESFKEKYSNEYTVLREPTANFEEYLDSEAITVTWTHFWDQYFHRTRKYSDRDFRLYAINYEYTGDLKEIDFWTKHIKESGFKILSISNYCSDFLKNAGVNANRISLLNLGYWREFSDYPTIFKVFDKPSYMVITNTNDPDRYGTETAIRALSEAFNDKKDKVHLVIKDYGANNDYVRNLINIYLKDFDVELSTGYLSNDDLAQLYLKADVLVNPFRGEGFGMKILEAGVSGLVTIAPNYGGPKDFLSQMESLMVNFNLSPIGKTIDKKLLLLNDKYVDCEVDEKDLIKKINESYSKLPQLKKSASEKAEALREKFSWDKVAENFGKVLEKVDINKTSVSNEVEKFNIKPEKVINKLEGIEVSVIINTYNRPDSLQESLGIFLNLPDLDKHKVEIVIVNDGSEKDYSSVIDSIKNPKAQIKYIHYPKNQGNSFSKNVGLYNAEGEISIFVGDDIHPLPGFIIRRVPVHRQSPKLLILGHTEWTPELRNNLIAEFSVKYSSFQFGYEIFRNFYEIYGANLYTSNISFVTQEIKSRNLYFDSLEKIVLYEDALWGINLERNGFQLAYDRKIEALHDHPVDYDWLMKRSKIIGATAARIYIYSPDSVKFTSAMEYLSLLKENYHLISASIEDKVAQIDLKYFEENLRKDYEELAKYVESTENYLQRRKYLLLLHRHLHIVNRFYAFLGYLEETNFIHYFSPLLLTKYYPQERVEVVQTVRPAIKYLLKNKLKETVYTFSKKFLKIN